MARSTLPEFFVHMSLTLFSKSLRFLLDDWNLCRCFVLRHGLLSHNMARRPPLPHSIHLLVRTHTQTCTQTHIHHAARSNSFHWSNHSLLSFISPYSHRYVQKKKSKVNTGFPNTRSCPSRVSDCRGQHGKLKTKHLVTKTSQTPAVDSRSYKPVKKVPWSKDTWK